MNLYRVHQSPLLALGPLVLGFAVSFASVAEAERADDQILRIASGVDDIGTMDPHFSVGTGEFAIYKSVYEALVLMPDGAMNAENLQPGLATDWSTDESGLVWTFTLREGVQWHHGYGEFTADDVQFSIERVLDPDVGSPFAENISIIDEVNVVDDYTVEIVTNVPTADLVSLLADYQSGFIVSKAAIEDGVDLRTEAVGTGPFMVENYQPRQGVTMARHDDYWRGEPIIEQIDYRFMSESNPRELALRAGEVHAIDIPADQNWVDRLRNEGFEVDLTAPANMFMIMYNMSREPLDDIRVRQALSHGIDRRELIQFLGEDVATPETSPLAEGYVGHTTDIPQYDYDPDRAAELLAEAGYEDGLEFEMVISNSNIYLPPMQVLQEQWRRIGIDVSLDVVDHPTYHSMIRDNVNPIVIYGAFRYPLTGTVYLTQFYHSDSAIGTDTAVTNFTHYGQILDGIDDLIEEAQFELDVDRQIELWEEAQYRIMEDAIVQPLFVRNYALARSPLLDLGHEQKSYSFYSFTHETQLLAE
ncbi:ABC transporter substrate-binding protein [Fodinicurvata sp. EGI_FJ10296]|uniref:ABC transporter substrate-binding protein n=1 Tax=Fodinicurvata sp. EGI_FJ10296 TaxID=3231908 RepID=UPI0034544E50